MEKENKKKEAGIGESILMLIGVVIASYIVMYFVLTLAYKSAIDTVCK